MVSRMLTYAAVVTVLPGVAAYTLGSCPQRKILAPGRPACTVQMNIGDRFVRLVKSNVNEALNKMEDPEKVLEQAVIDMQKDLVKVRQAYAEVSASTKRMEEQIRLAESEGAKWYSRAQLAIEKGE